MNEKNPNPVVVLLSNAIITLLLPIVTANTWIFTVFSAGILFVGTCVNRPLLYILGCLRGPR